MTGRTHRRGAAQRNRDVFLAALAASVDTRVPGIELATPQEARRHWLRVSRENAGGNQGPGATVQRRSAIPRARARAVRDLHLIDELRHEARGRGELRGLLREALENLSYRERRVLELRYGLGGEHPRTLDEVARTFNVTRERISWLESQALRQLRDESRA
jgi:RNA polymerase sigma factor (sigma-70 family)